MFIVPVAVIYGAQTIRTVQRIHSRKPKKLLFANVIKNCTLISEKLKIK